jgi:hypothetical protein
VGGVPYTDVGDNASTLLRGAGTSLIVGTVLSPITSTSRARRSSGGITSADPRADFAGVEVYRPPR